MTAGGMGVVADGVMTDGGMGVMAEMDDSWPPLVTDATALLAVYAGCEV